MLAIQFLSLFYFLAPRENKRRKEIMREHLFLFYLWGDGQRMDKELAGRPHK